MKRAMDRASGSGVFARDPDAQLDMIELEMSDATRNLLQRATADPAQPAPASKDTQQLATVTPETLATLREWMTKAGVDDSDLKRLVSQKGHFSADTPIDRYPEKFVTDWLMHNWSRVVTAIHNDPEYTPF